MNAGDTLTEKFIDTTIRRTLLATFQTDLHKSCLSPCGVLSGPLLTCRTLKIHPRTVVYESFKNASRYQETRVAVFVRQARLSVTKRLEFVKRVGLNG